jgi:alkanesulfonate monooxygenase SsuD/methylene tetrahydromethanopterin reductase-like flavin-dependent oxidoreductase (luciferase family)
VTERVGLGTAALVLPIRHPVLLAKELATLQHLSCGRAVLGVATGWDDGEFRAVAVPRSQRGARTDEALELIRRLLAEEEVSFRGRFHQVDRLTIYPRIPAPPPVWVAGGSLEHADETPDAPRIVPAVLRRLLAAEGWMSRSSGSDSTSVKRDWQEVRAFLAAHDRDPDTLTFAHTQFVHVVETSDRGRALDEQLPAFTRVMGDHRAPEDLAASYLLGTVEEMQDRVAGLVGAGLQYLILTPVTAEERQLELLTKHLVAPFTEEGQTSWMSARSSS